ncbi:hypothetical protein [Mesotoga prima]|uniref:hypothetical protein n=1 Tax=Mesotoga prima TaxID=1184387 RepID=UPI002FDFE088
MKRFLLPFLIVISVVLSAKTGLFLSVYPVLSLNNYTVHDRGYQPDFDDLRSYFSYPAFATAGVELSGSNYRALFRLDFRQDITSFLRGRSWSNFPIRHNAYTLYMDTDLPRVGFAEFENDFLRISAGKRKLHFGPATYNFVLSETVPYFEHLWLDLGEEVLSGKYFYSFFVISSDRSIFDSPRTLIGHSIGFEGSLARIGIVETNLISNTFPDLRDMSPFMVFHNNYAKNSNVNAGLFVESKIGSLDLYGMLYADDILIPGDRTENPTSLGWYLGGEAALIDGESYFGPVLWDGQFGLREKTLFRESGGLKLKYEHYHSTPYLYNRGFEEGKYINPIRFNADDIEGGAYLVINGFYGFPYGPDISLDLLALSYETRKIFTELRIEYIRQGSYRIEDFYGEPFEFDWYKLAEPITRKARLSLDFHYSPDEKQEFTLSASMALSGKPELSLKVGYGKLFTFLKF